MNRVDIGPTVRALRTGRKALYTRYYVAWAYFRTTGSTAGTANESILVGDGGERRLWPVQFAREQPVTSRYTGLGR